MPLLSSSTQSPLQEETPLVKILLAAIAGAAVAALVVTVTTVSLSGATATPVNQPLYNYGDR